MKKLTLTLALLLSMTSFAQAYAKWTPDGYKSNGVTVMPTDNGGYYIYN